jgi:formylglycine-generating enzyme required for sulfatase activity
MVDAALHAKSERLTGLDRGRVDASHSRRTAGTPPGMVWIPGGTFLMGSDNHYPEEAPAHRVTVDGFWVDQNTVTNRQVAHFVAKTGYVTDAERAPDPADNPGAKPELLAPASTVFVAPRHRVDLTNPYNWWIYVAGADWRHPQGPGTRSGQDPIIRSCTSPGPKCRRTRPGPASSYPPRPGPVRRPRRTGRGRVRLG